MRYAQLFLDCGGIIRINAIRNADCVFHVQLYRNTVRKRQRVGKDAKKWRIKERKVGRQNDSKVGRAAKLLRYRGTRR